jgi:hypothetical protein
MLRCWFLLTNKHVVSITIAYLVTTVLAPGTHHTTLSSDQGLVDVGTWFEPSYVSYGFR